MHYPKNNQWRMHLFEGKKEKESTSSSLEPDDI
jgi:hypothetical protein